MASAFETSFWRIRELAPNFGANEKFYLSPFGDGQIEQLLLRIHFDTVS